MEGIMKNLLGLALLCSFSICFAVQENSQPWSAPCERVHLKHISSNKTTVSHNVSRFLSDLVNIINNQTSLYEEWWRSIEPNEDIHLSDILHLFGLPLYAVNDIINMDKNVLHQVFYTTLSKIWIYIEQAWIDAEVYQDERMPIAILHNYNSIIDIIGLTLCQIMQTRETEMDNIVHITRSIMPEIERQTSNVTDRFYRDLIIFRDSKNIIYELLKQG